MKKVGQSLIIALFIILFINSASLASETEYIVKSGDSLWKIACEHGVSVDDLMTLNQLQSDRLNIGDRLKIRTVSQASQVSLSPSEPVDIYIVQTGDCLGMIADKAGMSLDQIRRFNNLDSDLIKVGQELKVVQTSPDSSSTQPTVSPGSAGYVVQSGDLVASTDSTGYIVQPGDCLSSIAQKNSISMLQLKNINGLMNDTIYPGDCLIVSVSDEQVSRSSSPLGGQLLVNTAAKYLGTPYVYGGCSPNGFDCSGFVKYVYSECGYTLPRTAASQYQEGVEVTKGNLTAGDLVFFAGNGYSIDHVGIYVGNNTFIHSSSPRSGGVIYTSLNSSYYLNSYVGAKRIIR